MLAKKDLRILGLNKKECLVLQELQKADSSPSSLAKNLNLPRTTIAFLLNRLKERELVAKEKHGKRFVWKSASFSDLAQKLRSASNLLDPLTALFTVTKGKRQSEIEIYRGPKKMQEAVLKILKVGRGNRVYSVQGSTAAESALRDIERDFMLGFHKEIKQRGVILEGIVSEKILHMFETMDLEQLKSHMGRLTVVYFAPDEFFDFSIDMFVFQNILMIVNYEEKTILLIKDSVIQNALQKIIHFMETCSKKINLNAHIQKIIEKKENV